MVKSYSGRGFSSTPQINERDLAARQKGVTALLDDIIQLEFNCSPEKTVEQLEQIYHYPETPILDALSKYLESSTVTLHIPGHSRGEGILPKLEEVIGSRAIKADTTDDFDGLGQLLPPSGPIKEAQDLAAKTFNAAYTFFLINGSTVGNIALALTATRPGEKVLLARNCHRSVISGVSTSGAHPVWLIPERDEEWGIWGEVKAEKVRKLLVEHPDASVVWLTNPTYEGVVSDVRAIAEVCKEFDAMLIVDEAHGSHWNFNNRLPQTALNLGADAVVNSIHKTAGSFSQSSMLHLGHNSKIDYDELLCNLRMLQSTSPSYLLLASLDAARSYLESEPGRNRLDCMVQYADEIRVKINDIPGCHCMSANSGYKLDPTKLYVSIEGISGKKLKDILEYEFHIEVEAKTDKGILALANIGNTIAEVEYFFEVIQNIASRKQIYLNEQLETVKHMPFSIPEMFCLPREAYFSKKEKVKVADSPGRVSAEVVAYCPPGIAIVVPGERIVPEHLEYLNDNDFIWVMKEA